MKRSLIVASLLSASQSWAVSDRGGREHKLAGHLLRRPAPGDSIAMLHRRPK